MYMNNILNMSNISLVEGVMIATSLGHGEMGTIVEPQLSFTLHQLQQKPD